MYPLELKLLKLCSKEGEKMKQALNELKDQILLENGMGLSVCNCGRPN